MAAATTAERAEAIDLLRVIGAMLSDGELESVGGWVTTAVRGKKAVITRGPSSATDFNATFAPWSRATPDMCDANSRWERVPASTAA